MGKQINENDKTSVKIDRKEKEHHKGNKMDAVRSMEVDSADDEDNSVKGSGRKSKMETKMRKTINKLKTVSTKQVPKLYNGRKIFRMLELQVIIPCKVIRAEYLRFRLLVLWKL